MRIIRNCKGQNVTHLIFTPLQNELIVYADTIKRNLIYYQYKHLGVSSGIY